MRKNTFGLILAGAAAGAVNGLLGAGGGMVLLPLLGFVGIEEEERFPSSVAIIAPTCVVSLAFSALAAPLPWADAFPWLIGSARGGTAAGRLGKKIPVIWLHRTLGLLILWGGIRYLC